MRLDHLLSKEPFGSLEPPILVFALAATFWSFFRLLPFARVGGWLLVVVVAGGCLPAALCSSAVVEGSTGYRWCKRVVEGVGVVAVRVWLGWWGRSCWLAGCLVGAAGPVWVLCLGGGGVAFGWVARMLLGSLRAPGLGFPVGGCGPVLDWSAAGRVARGWCVVFDRLRVCASVFAKKPAPLFC